MDVPAAVQRYQCQVEDYVVRPIKSSVPSLSYFMLSGRTHGCAEVPAMRVMWSDDLIKLIMRPFL
eukprot:scaffold29672_cov22-Cyclotella_meneghiniana.AAC.3